jgi:hypothetical protein
LKTSAIGIAASRALQHHPRLVQVPDAVGRKPPARARTEQLPELGRLELERADLDHRFEPRVASASGKTQQHPASVTRRSHFWRRR